MKLTLPQIAETKIKFTIHGQEYVFEKATIRDLADVKEQKEKILQQYKNMDSVGIVFSTYCLYVSLRKNYPDVTVEYVEKMFGVINSDLALMEQILVKLGFTEPQTQPKQEVKAKKK